MNNSVKNKVTDFFAKRKDVRVVFAFDDGNLFTDKNFALNHQRQTKANFEVCNREDFPAEETPAKKEKNEAKKASVFGLNDQLKELDLDKVEGKDYQVIKKLVEGLRLEVENYKFNTLLEALKQAKANLLSK